MKNTTQSAIDQCRDNNLEFYQKALRFSIAFVNACNVQFTVDDIKTQCYRLIDPPREPRCWGSIIRQLKKDGYIFDLKQNKKSDDPICHERPKAVYISRSYREERQRRSYSFQGSLNLFA